MCVARQSPMLAPLLPFPLGMLSHFYVHWPFSIHFGGLLSMVSVSLSQLRPSARACPAERANTSPTQRNTAPLGPAMPAMGALAQVQPRIAPPICTFIFVRCGEVFYLGSAFPRQLSFRSFTTAQAGLCARATPVAKAMNLSQGARGSPGKHWKTCLTTGLESQGSGLCFRSFLCCLFSLGLVLELLLRRGQLPHQPSQVLRQWDLHCRRWLHLRRLALVAF
jgi:hypothetical protein